MNIINILEENAQLFAKSPAVIDCNNNRCLNYGDLWHKVNAAAYGLMSIGVGAGDRVALYLNNGVEFIIAYLAILRLGAIAVPFNIQLKRCEIKRILQSSEAKVIIGANKELNQEVKPIRKDVPNLITTIGVGQHDEENLIDAKFEDLLNENGTVPKVELEDDQPAAIHFTSGTTGRMKGVILSHNNIAANAKINGHYLLGLNDQDRVLGVSPFCHVYFFQVVLGPLSVGACAVTIPRSSPKLALQAVEKYRVTHISTVPTMLRYMLNQYRERNYDISSWRVAGTAATNISLELVKEIKDTFNVDMFDTYGCTEASSTITYTRLRHYITGSVGAPAHGYSVKLLDDQGNEVPVGEIGELVVKGPGIFLGYWKMPEETKEAFTSEGWYKSGDLARQDKQGNLYIVGRKKDVIVSGGYNIYPWEVEEVLLSHPDIEDAVVIGRPDTDLGEIPVGYVILKDKASLEQKSVLSFCQKRLAKYKCPRDIIFRTAFKRSGSGKILKRCLD